jgi:hypothetical protein
MQEDSMPKRIGIVEGFHWTEQHAVNGKFGEYDAIKRIALMSFLKKWGYTTYIYAPKVHRAENTFQSHKTKTNVLWSPTFEEARKHGIEFLWEIAPGHSSVYQNRKKDIFNTIASLQKAGAAGIVMLFDDAGGLATEDQLVQQCQLAHEISMKFPDYLKGFCSSCYHSGFEDLEWIPSKLDADLPENVALFWTGKAVWSNSMEMKDFPELARRDIWIWDNWMASDTSAPDRLEMNPPRRRSKELLSQVGGYFLNPVFPLDRVIPVLCGAGIVANNPGESLEYIHQEMIDAWHQWLGIDRDVCKCLLLKAWTGKKVSVLAKYDDFMASQIASDWVCPTNDHPLGHIYIGINHMRENPDLKEWINYIIHYG